MEKCQACQTEIKYPIGSYYYEDRTHGVYRISKTGAHMPILVCDLCYTAHLKEVYPHATPIIEHHEEKLKTYAGIQEIPPKRLPEFNPPLPKPPGDE